MQEKRAKLAEAQQQLEAFEMLVKEASDNPYSKTASHVRSCAAMMATQPVIPTPKDVGVAEQAKKNRRGYHASGQLAATDMTIIEMLGLELNPPLHSRPIQTGSIGGGGVRLVPPKLLPVSPPEGYDVDDAASVRELEFNSDTLPEGGGIRLKPPKLLSVPGHLPAGLSDMDDDAEWLLDAIKLDDDSLSPSSYGVDEDTLIEGSPVAEGINGGWGVRLRPPKLFVADGGVPDAAELPEGERANASHTHRPSLKIIMKVQKSLAKASSVDPGLDGGGGVRALPPKLLPVDVGLLNAMLEDDTSCQAILPEPIDPPARKGALLSRLTLSKASFLLLGSPVDSEPGTPHKNGGGIRVHPPKLLPIDTGKRGGGLQDPQPGRHAPTLGRDKMREAIQSIKPEGTEEPKQGSINTSASSSQLGEAPLRRGASGGGGVRAVPPCLLVRQPLPPKAPAVKRLKSAPTALRQHLQGAIEMVMEQSPQQSSKDLQTLLQDPHTIRQMIAQLEAEQAMLTTPARRDCCAVLAAKCFLCRRCNPLAKDMPFRSRHTRIAPVEPIVAKCGASSTDASDSLSVPNRSAPVLPSTPSLRALKPPSRSAPDCNHMDVLTRVSFASTRLKQGIHGQVANARQKTFEPKQATRMTPQVSEARLLSSLFAADDGDDFRNPAQQIRCFEGCETSAKILRSESGGTVIRGSARRPAPSRPSLGSAHSLHSGSHDATQHSPQQKVPGTSPMIPQAPRMEAPRTEAPRMEAPRNEAPRMEAPRMAAPRRPRSVHPEVATDPLPPLSIRRSPPAPPTLETIRMAPNTPQSDHPSLDGEARAPTGAASVKNEIASTPLRALEAKRKAPTIPQRASPGSGSEAPAAPTDAPCLRDVPSSPPPAWEARRKAPTIPPRAAPGSGISEAPAAPTDAAPRLRDVPSPPPPPWEASRKPPAMPQRAAPGSGTGEAPAAPTDAAPRLRDVPSPPPTAWEAMRKPPAMPRRDAPGCGRAQ